MKNFTKNSEQIFNNQILCLQYKKKQYRLELLNTGFDEVKKGRDKKRRLPKEHTHKVFHFVVFNEGDAYYLHNGEKKEFTPGTIAIINPDEPHSFGPIPCKTAYNYFFLTFSLLEIESNAPLSITFREFLELYTGEKLCLPTSPLAFNKRQSSTFAKFVTILTQQLNSKAKFSQVSSAKTMVDIIEFILYEVYSESIESNSEIPTLCPRIEQAKNFIEENFTEKITIEKLASIAAFEPCYFIRKFKNTFHITPVNYQMELRITAAETLLLTSNLRIYEIAEQLGFSDMYYFSRIFKKLKGVSPTTFRNQPGKL